MFSIKGKIALIVGGTSGIGKEISLGFADAGATVIPVSRDINKVNKIVEEINNKKRSKSIGFSLDARDIVEFRKMVRRIISVYGKIDILVNSQGTTAIKAAEDFNEEEFDFIISTNLKSVFFSCVEVGKYMLKNGQGSIINIASMAAFRGWRSCSVYCMSKWGVVSLTQTLGAEWASRGVRVNAIAPGQFMTPLNRDKMKADRKEAILQRTPMKRFGELPELLGAALLLASDASSFMTGETIRIDGGYLAMGI